MGFARRLFTGSAACSLLLCARGSYDVVGLLRLCRRRRLLSFPFYQLFATFYVYRHTMATLSSSGYYCDIPVVIRMDPSTPTSILSSDFTLSQSIPLSVSVSDGIVLRAASGPLQVPTACGRYLSTLRLSVGYVSDADVVLGSDWISNPLRGVQLGAVSCRPCQGVCESI